MDEYQTRRLERLKFLSAHTNQLAGATQAFEHAALRALFITNGGAAIATLAFVGSEAANKLNVGIALIALSVWAFGLFCAGGASWLMYFSQLEFYKASSQHLKATTERDEGNESQARKHDAAHDDRTKEAMGAASLVAFLLGGFFGSASRAAR
jgi:choline-glycine betaine transporter